MADTKISQLDEQGDVPADPGRAWIAIVVDGETKKIALATILAAAQS